MSLTHCVCHTAQGKVKWPETTDLIIGPVEHLVFIKELDSYSALYKTQEGQEVIVECKVGLYNSWIETRPQSNE